MGPYRGSIGQRPALELTQCGPRAEAGAINRLRLFAPFLLMCVLCLHYDREFSLSSGSEPTNKAREGQHDCYFDLGKWKTHSSRLLHPLTRSTTWAEMAGITVVSEVWDGRSNLAE
jgi:hypothetical protein